MGSQTLFVALFLLFFMGISFAWSDLGGGICECSSCTDCTSALDNTTNCTKEVWLNQSISTTSSCISNPTNFNNKILDCKGYSMTGNLGANSAVWLWGKENLTIQNCIINTFGYTIDLRISASTNVTIYNNTINGSNHQSIWLQAGSNNCNISHNRIFNSTGNAIELTASSDNYVVHNTLRDNSAVGIRINTLSYRNLISDNSVVNSSHGFYIYSATSTQNNFTNNNASYNTINGFYLFNSLVGNRFVNNRAFGNAHAGVYIDTTNGAHIFINTTLYNNTYDFFSFRGTSYTANNTLFLNPFGTLVNYTNLTIVETGGAAVGIWYNWTTNSSALDSPATSFAQKYVEIRTTLGTPSIDSIIWHWIPTELAGYAESTFQIWKYSGGSWSDTLATLNLPEHTLTLSNVNPASIYGIVQKSTCMEITSAGTYLLANNLLGAPTSAIAWDITNACIVINSSNVEFNCNGYTITHDGSSALASGIFVPTNGLTNITIHNCTVSGYNSGIYLRQVSVFDVHNMSIYNCSSRGAFFDYVTTDGSVENNTFRNSTYCIYSFGSFRNNFTTNTLTECTNRGIYISGGNNARLTSNTIRLSNYGIYTSSVSNMVVNNNFICDNTNGAFLATSTTSTTFINNVVCNLSGLVNGFYLYSGSQGNTLINNTAHNCGRRGFYLSDGTNNKLINNTARNNGNIGFLLWAETNLNLTNNTAHSNALDGFYLARCSNAHLDLVHTYNNTGDELEIETDATPRQMNITNLIVDCEYGTYENYTNLSISDTLTANSGYTINWASNSSTLPSGLYSFANKYVSIAVSLGTPSIDNITWHWVDSEVTPFYTEDFFELMKESGADWNSVGATLNTADNTLNLLNMNPASKYGILQNNASECMIINESGSYQLKQDIEGAPINILTDVELSDANWGCIVISASDVLFDCAGYNISNNATFTSAGIFINGTTAINRTNVTIQNCPSIYNYSFGIYDQRSKNHTIRNTGAISNMDSGFKAYYLYDSLFQNNTAHGISGSSAGFYLEYSNSTHLIDNLANGSSLGFYLGNCTHIYLSDNLANTNLNDGFEIIESNYTHLTDNRAYGNTRNGFEILRGEYASLVNNTAHNNTLFGFELRSEYVSVINNTAYYNPEAGFYQGADYGIFTNNTAYNNIDPAMHFGYGFQLDRAGYNNLTNNIAHNNSEDGFRIYESNHTRLIGNLAYNNSEHGFQILGSSQWTYIGNGTSHHNSEQGFRISASSYNTIANSLAYDNGIRGFVVTKVSSENNTIANNTAYGHVDVGALGAGFGMFEGLGNNFTNNTAHSNHIGVVMNNPAGINRFNLTILYNNTMDFVPSNQGGASAYTYYSWNTTFLPDSGVYNNYSVIDLEDSVAIWDIYILDWTSNSSALPANYASFRQKFVNISHYPIAPTPTSISKITWKWDDLEITGDYDESQFELWKYNASVGWTMINNTPDTSANTLAQYNMDPESDYGILQNNFANVSVFKLDQTVLQPSPGGVVEFNITINNTGTVTLNVLVVDELPLGLTYLNSYPAPDSQVGQVITWNNAGPIAPAVSTVLYLNATVDAGVVFPGQEILNLTNYANATGTAPAVVDSFEESYANATVHYANVSALKLNQTVDTPSEGGIVEFNLTITNTGNVTLNPVFVNDTLPAGLDYLNANLIPDSTAGGELLWNNIGSLAPGISVLIFLNATVNETAAGGCDLSVTNQLNVVGVPPNGDNVTASDTEGIYLACANISVLKLGQTAQQPSPGGIVQFNFTITNLGNVTLNPVEVIDELPSGLTYSNADPNPNAILGQVSTWYNLGPLAPGASTTIYLNATVDAGIVGPGSEIVNLTNYVNATGVPPNGNNVTSESYANATIYYANISALKTDITALPPSPGGLVEFQITVRNIGNVTLSPISIVDTLPTGFTYNSTNTLPVSVAGQTVNWTITLGPGTTQIINLNAIVDSVTPPGQYTNIVTVEGSPPDGDNVTDSDSVVVGVNSSAINAVKTASEYLVEVGDTVTFNLTITNTGQVNLTVWVQDTLPTQLSYNAGEADPLPTSVVGKIIYWDAIAIGLGSGETTNITYNVSVGAAGPMSNAVTITGVPPNGDNVTDSDSVTLNTVAPTPPSNGGSDKLELVVESMADTCWEEVRFVVKDGGKKVENAKIYIKRGREDFASPIYSDEDGKATFTPAQPGTYYAYAAKGGYTDSSRVPFAISSSIFNVDAPTSASEGEEFTIKVTSNGEVVEGAKLTIDGEAKFTDQNGEVRFSLERGIHLITVEKQCYISWTRSITVNEGEEIIIIEEDEEPDHQPESPEVVIIEEEPEPEPPFADPEAAIEKTIPLVESAGDEETKSDAIASQWIMWLILLLLLATIGYYVLSKKKTKKTH